jgi:hypothetical protein
LHVAGLQLCGLQGLITGLQVFGPHAVLGPHPDGAQSLGVHEVAGAHAASLSVMTPSTIGGV